jgi:hypothetical protein
VREIASGEGARQSPFETLDNCQQLARERSKETTSLDAASHVAAVTHLVEGRQDRFPGDIRITEPRIRMFGFTAAIARKRVTFHLPPSRS